MAEVRKPVRFTDLLRVLIDKRVDFIIVGGVAGVLEGAPVSTFDLDIVYANSEANVVRLTEALDDLRATYVDPAGRTIRPDADRLSRGGHHLFRTRFGRLDVLAHVGAELTYDDLFEQSAERIVHGMRILVLGLETLIATKESADRPKDRAVLDLLRETLALRGTPSDD